MEEGDYDVYEGDDFGDVDVDEDLDEDLEEEKVETEEIDEETVEAEEEIEELEEDETEVEAEAEAEAELVEEEVEREEKTYEPDEVFIKQLVDDVKTDDYITDFQKMIDSRAKLMDLPSPQRRLTKYEFTAIIGFRAQQIAEGAPPYVTVSEGTDPITIAIMEFDKNLIPLMVERPLPANKIGKFKYETYQLDQLLNVLNIK